MVLLLPGGLRSETQAGICPSRDKSDRTGSFLGGEGSQAQWEVPGSPTPSWWPSYPLHPTGPHQLVPACPRNVPPHSGRR